MTTVMNPLDIAEAARVAECGRYEITGSMSHHFSNPPYGSWGVVEMGSNPALIHLRDKETRAECDAWIARRGNAAFVRALANHLTFDPALYFANESAASATRQNPSRADGGVRWVTTSTDLDHVETMIVRCLIPTSRKVRIYTLCVDMAGIGPTAHV